MKSLILITAILLSSNVFSNEIKILSWSRLNSNTNTDSAAEVCFSLSPKPTAPVFTEITVDQGTRVEGLYSTWIGTKGSTCHVVSTLRGRVQIEIPALKIKKEFTKK